MSDNLRWFKVWTSITSDPDFLDMSLEEIGRWVLLGAYIAQHGDKGSLKYSEKALRQVLRIPENVTVDATINAIHSAKIKAILGDEKRIVTFEKWHKYQVDSSATRMRKMRQNVTVQEEKRRDKKRTTPKSPKTDGDFERFYKAYPRKVNRPGAEKAWQKIKPQNGEVELILQGIEKWKLSDQWTRDGGQYIPHPATWLNRRGWEDEPKGGESWR